MRQYSSFINRQQRIHSHSNNPTNSAKLQLVSSRITKVHTTTNMTQSKDQKIAETQANLPLPDQPPAASDWQSADATKVNVGAGKTEGAVGTDSAAQAGIREPSSKSTDMDMSNIGREGKDNLSGPPKDAAA